MTKHDRNFILCIAGMVLSLPTINFSPYLGAAIYYTAVFAMIINEKNHAVR